MKRQKFDDDYPFFEAVAQPAVVDDGEDGGGRRGEVLERVHQNEIEHHVVESDGFHA